jgi:hypothetical protein
MSKYNCQKLGDCVFLISTNNLAIAQSSTTLTDQRKLGDRCFALLLAHHLY